MKIAEVDPITLVVDIVTSVHPLHSEGVRATYTLPLQLQAQCSKRIQTRFRFVSFSYTCGLLYISSDENSLKLNLIPMKSMRLQAKCPRSDCADL